MSLINHNDNFNTLRTIITADNLPTFKKNIAAYEVPEERKKIEIEATKKIKEIFTALRATNDPLYKNKFSLFQKLIYFIRPLFFYLYFNSVLSSVNSKIKPLVQEKFRLIDEKYGSIEEIKKIPAFEKTTLEGIVGSEKIIGRLPDFKNRIKNLNNVLCEIEKEIIKLNKEEINTITEKYIASRELQNESEPSSLNTIAIPNFEKPKDGSFTLYQYIKNKHQFLNHYSKTALSYLSQIPVEEPIKILEAELKKSQEELKLIKNLNQKQIQQQSKQDNVAKARDVLVPKLMSDISILEKEISDLQIPSGNFKETTEVKEKIIELKNSLTELSNNLKDPHNTLESLKNIYEAINSNFDQIPLVITNLGEKSEELLTLQKNLNTQFNAIEDNLLNFDSEIADQMKSSDSVLSKKLADVYQTKSESFEKFSIKDQIKFTQICDEGVELFLSDLTSLKSTLSDSQKNIETKNLKYTEKQNELTKFSQDNPSFNEDYSSFDIIYQNFNKIKDNKKTLDENKKTLEENKKTLEDKDKRLNNEKSSLYKISFFGYTTTELIDDTKVTADKLSAAIESLNKNTKELEKNRGNLENNKRDLENNKTDIQTQINLAKSFTVKYNTDNKNIKSTLDNLKLKQTNLKSEVGITLKAYEDSKIGILDIHNNLIAKYKVVVESIDQFKPGETQEKLFISLPKLDVQIIEENKVEKLEESNKTLPKNDLKEKAPWNEVSAFSDEFSKLLTVLVGNSLEGTADKKKHPEGMIVYNLLLLLVMSFKNGNEKLVIEKLSSLTTEDKRKDEKTEEYAKRKEKDTDRMNHWKKAFRDPELKLELTPENSELLTHISSLITDHNPSFSDLISDFNKVIRSKVKFNLESLKELDPYYDPHKKKELNRYTKIDDLYFSSTKLIEKEEMTENEKKEIEVCKKKYATLLNKILGIPEDELINLKLNSQLLLLDVLRGINYCLSQVSSSEKNALKGIFNNTLKELTTKFAVNVLNWHSSVPDWIFNPIIKMIVTAEFAMSELGSQEERTDNPSSILFAIRNITITKFYNLHTPKIKKHAPLIIRPYWNLFDKLNEYRLNKNEESIKNLNIAVDTLLGVLLDLGK